MTKIKCVGGPFDNREVEKTGDPTYVFHAYEPISKVDFDAPPKEFGTYETHVYTWRHLSIGPTLIVEYLAPQDWTFEQVMRHQFTKGVYGEKDVRERLKRLETVIEEVTRIMERDPVFAGLASVLKSLLR